VIAGVDWDQLSIVAAFLGGFVVGVGVVIRLSRMIVEFVRREDRRE